ncbi:MAG: DNA metabolism protein [Flavobacteriaceae bacterium]|nr:DNA metabolism protein [Flavobacteriaceae bacterium]
MGAPQLIIYDGSFEGFLSAVFHTYEHRLAEVDIQPAIRAQATFFGTTTRVETNVGHAGRVWHGITKKVEAAGAHILYRTFLSERAGVENLLLDRIRDIFAVGNKNSGNFSDATVLEIAKINKMVGREKHRMEAFVRFKLTKDGIYFAVIEPDFNVLPLIAEHFRSRYADQKWLIYDTKRGIGLYYDLDTMSEITMRLSGAALRPSAESTVYTSEELEYQQLWSTYFESTNIASRRNMKLHKRHIPQRYWKYLSEKSLQLKK